MAGTTRVTRTGVLTEIEIDAEIRVTRVGVLTEIEQYLFPWPSEVYPYQAGATLNPDLSRSVPCVSDSYIEMRCSDGDVLRDISGTRIVVKDQSNAVVADKTLDPGIMVPGTLVIWWDDLSPTAAMDVAGTIEVTDPLGITRTYSYTAPAVDKAWTAGGDVDPTPGW